MTLCIVILFLINGFVPTMLVLSILFFLMVSTRYASKIAHFLNNIFHLPHPGPNDQQGSCSCREHEKKTITKRKTKL